MAGQQDMEVACKCQYSNVSHLPPRARCITGTQCEVHIILPIINWSLAMDGGAWQS